MNKNRRIIKFEEFDFEAANNTGKFINKSLREKAEIDAMKSFTESEIKNAVTIVNRAFNKELTESVEDLIILENIFSGLYNSIKNNVKKLGDIRNAVSGKMGEIKQFLANLGINKKMSPDEVAIIISKLLGQKGLIEDFKESAEDAPKSLMTKIFSALGATSGLGGVLTYVITTIIGIGKGGNFQHGLGDTGAIVSAIALGLALLSGIAYAFSAHKDELAHKANLASVRNNESRRNKNGKKVNENLSEGQDILKLRNSIKDINDKIMNDEDPDGDLFITISHSGNDATIELTPENINDIINILDMHLDVIGYDFKPENTESSNLDDDYSDIESEPSNEEPNWNKFESLRNKRNNKRKI